MARPEISGAPRRRRPDARPPREALTRDRIAEAALAIIDAGGVDALNMRAVAERLGTGPASLYAHVDSKEALLDLVYNAVVAEMDMPLPTDPADWAETVKQAARVQRQVLVSHRDVARLSLGRFPTSLEAMGAVERLLAVLRAGGLSDRVVALAPDLLSLYVDAVTLEETHYDPQIEPEDVEEWIAQMRAYFAGLNRQTYPNVVELASELTGYDGEQRFEFGLEVIVRGLQAIADDERDATEPPV